MARAGRILLRVAGVIAIVNGLGFGAFAIPGMIYLAEHGRVWGFGGFNSYGPGLFGSELGIRPSVPLIAGFLVVCVALVVAGVLLWARPRAGVALTLVIAVPMLGYALGFSLPFAVYGILQVAFFAGLGWALLSSAPNPAADPAQY